MKKLFTMLMIMVFAFGVNAQKFAKKKLTVDKTPHSAVSVTSNSKAQWDVLFTFNAVEAGSPGIETDGTNFYTTTWNAGNFHRYDMDGANGTTFTVAGVSNVRDMAYDGQYFYGAAADMNLFQMDLANETLVSTITATCTGITGIRHIAYDPTLDGGNGGFWIGNWNELGAIAMDGSELVAGGSVTLESCYGSAYDNWSDPTNPKLWLFQQPTGAEAIFYEFDINTMAMTGVTHDASDAPGFLSGSISGGACTYEAGGKFILAGNIQQDPNLIVGYELATTVAQAAPAAVSDYVVTPDAGGALTATLSWTNPSLDFAGNTLTELTSMDAYVDGNSTPDYTNASPVIGGTDGYVSTVASAGMHSFKVLGTNSAGTGMPTSVSVWVGEDVPVAPGNVVLTATDMDVSLAWDASAAGMHGGYFSGSNITYTVVRQPGNVTVSTDQTGLTFNETLANTGNYYYEVTASNLSGEGGTGTSNSLIVGTYLLYEVFETEIPGTWTVTGDWYWNDGTGNNLDGTGFSYIDSDAPGSGVNVAGELISPVIPCTGTVTLEFDQYYNYISDETATVDIWDGAAWQTVADFGNGGADLGAWGAPDHQVIDISTYANNECKIRFNYDDLSNWNWYWAVDNVTVAGQSTIGINTIDAQGINVFPNPSNGVFNINVENNYNLEVFDITGRVINTRTLTGNTSIELNTSGVYFLRFSNEKGSFTQKVIVQ